MRLCAVLMLLALSPSLARADSADDEAARVHFLSGQAYYDQANYEDALREFTEAYRTSQRPALLYNVALCHERLDQLAEAVTALERYLQLKPDAEDRATVESRIKNLKERQKRAPAPAPALVAPPESVIEKPAPPKPRKRVATWVVGGVGLGLLGGALASGIVAETRFESLKTDCGGGFACDSSKVSDLDARRSQGHSAAIATDVLWPLGTAAIVTAIILYVVEGRPHRP